MNLGIYNFLKIKLSEIEESIFSANKSERFLIVKPTNALISQIYFGNETLHVSDSSSVHHQELFTVHTAMVYVIQVCRQLSSRIRMEFHQELLTVHSAVVYVIHTAFEQQHPDPALKLSTNLYDIYHY
jgi:hypothetical protein